MLKINRHSSSSLWIGLNDIGTEASYKWSDGSPVAYTNYNYREPNDWIGVEDCLEMYRWNGKWNDLHCSMLRPYICKKTNSKCASFCLFVCFCFCFFYNHYYSKIRLSLIVRVNVVLCGSHLQSHTLKMTTALRSPGRSNSTYFLMIMMVMMIIIIIIIIIIMTYRSPKPTFCPN